MDVGALPAWPTPKVPGVSFLVLMLHLAASYKVRREGVSHFGNTFLGNGLLIFFSL